MGYVNLTAVGTDVLASIEAVLDRVRVDMNGISDPILLDMAGAYVESVQMDLSDVREELRNRKIGIRYMPDVVDPDDDW